MKRVFYLLLSAAMVITTTLMPTTIFINVNINKFEKQDIKIYQPNSFKNIIRNFNNTKDMEELEQDQKVRDILDQQVEKFYQEFFTNKKGKLVSLNMESRDEIILQTFDNDYANESPNEQIFKTQEYQKTITNTHSFSISLLEKASFKTSFKVPFVSNTEINVEVISDQKWNDITTSSEKLVYPSQEFKVSPFSYAKATYIIKQGTYDNDGVISFSVDLSDYFDFPMMAKDNDGSNTNYWVRFTMRDIIDSLNDLGLGNKIKMDLNQYSIITTDNPKKPTKAYLNLPISWESQGGKLDVKFSEEPISKF